MTSGKISQTALTNSKLFPIVSLTFRHSYSRGISITIIRKKYRRLILVAFIKRKHKFHVPFIFNSGTL